MWSKMSRLACRKNKLLIKISQGNKFTEFPGGKERMTCCLSSSTHRVGENPKGFMATEVPPRAAALISSRPLLLVSQWKDVFGEGIHPAGLITQAQTCRAPWHGAAASPKSPETLTQGCRSRAQHSQSTDTNTHRALLPGEVLRAAQSHGRGHCRGHLEGQHKASCREGSHSPALLSGPCRAPAGQAQGVETTESLVGRNRAQCSTARWELSPGIWDISAKGDDLHLWQPPQTSESSCHLCA